MPFALLRELIAEATFDSADHAYRLTVTATNDRSDGGEPAIAAALDPVIDPALAAVDAINAIADDTVEDFDAQPTAYRVRTPMLDPSIAATPPR